MSSWILVLIIFSGMRDGGTTSQSIEMFKSENDCVMAGKSAVSSLEKQSPRSGPFIYTYACLERP